MEKKLDFGESDRMIKISEKVDKSNIYNRFSGNISFFNIYIYYTKTTLFVTLHTTFPGTSGSVMVSKLD